MNSIRLCSTGDVLTIWEGSGYNPVHTFSPTSGVRKIISSSWSYDGSCVASCVEGSDKILITDVKSTSCMTVDVDTVLGVNPIRVQYPRTSLKLLIVGSTDKVLFYDVGKQKIRKEFKLTNDVKLTSIATNFNDSYVAVGGTGGHVFLLNAVTGQTGVPMKSESLQNTTAVKYSRFRNSVLGTSGESGQVSLWDCNANKLTHSFLEHHAPVTGIAFSPLNEVLMLSSGLDKRCVCYDVTMKRAMSTIKTEYPLTSVDFGSDGMTLALGTTNGQILIYDLRSFKSPTKVLNAHPGKVESALFQISERPSFGSAFKSGSVSSTASTGPRHGPSLNSTSNGTTSKATLTGQHSKKNLSMKENLPSISENPESSSNGFALVDDVFVVQASLNADCQTNEKRESFSSQVFSPLRDHAAIFSPLGSDLNFGRRSNLSSSRVSHESIFSPLKENSGNTSAKGTPRQATAFNSPNKDESRASDWHRQTPQTGESSKQIFSFRNISGNSTPVSRKPTGSTAQKPFDFSLNFGNLDVMSTPETRRVNTSSTEESMNIYNVDASTNKMPEALVSSVKDGSVAFETSAGVDIDNLAVISAHKVDVLSDLEMVDVDVVENKPKKHRPSLDNDRSYGIKHVLTAFPDIMDPGFQAEGQDQPPPQRAQEPEINASDFFGPRGDGAAGPNIGDNIGQFRDEYFRGIVRDAMDEFCFSMRKQLWHIHYDYIRGFERQRTELKNILSEYAVNEALVAENKQLREEIERMKKSPFVACFDDE